LAQLSGKSRSIQSRILTDKPTNIIDVFCANTTFIIGYDYLHSQYYGSAHLRIPAELKKIIKKIMKKIKPKDDAAFLSFLGSEKD